MSKGREGKTDKRRETLVCKLYFESAFSPAGCGDIVIQSLGASVQQTKEIMSAFQFPMLPRSDIVEILAECQIMNITESDLMNPSTKFVSDLYASLLIYLDSLQEDHGQVDFAALEQFENPDMHVDSVRVLNLFNKIRDVVTAVGYPERSFMLDDLVRPDTSRTMKFLSAILNFVLHKNARMNLLRPYVEEVSLLDEQRKERDARISQLKAEIAEYDEAREKEIPLVQEAQTKVKDLRQMISNLNNHQVSLRASMRKMKEKAKEKDEKISKAEFELVQSVQENANLHSRIVQSPDKLQRALEEKKAILLEAKKSEKLAMQSFEDKSAILEVYTKARKKMSKHFNQMQAMQEQVNSAKINEKDVKQLKAKLSEESILNMSLESKVVEWQAKSEQLDEHKRQLEKERDIRRDEERNELNNVKSEVESRRRDFEAKGKRIEAVILQADAAKSKINSVKLAGAAKQQELLRKCEEVVDEYYNYSNLLSSI